MNKCVYKDKVISAEDYAAKFETETELRKNAKELYCCDPDCQSPVIFRHGVKRVAHFAHKAGNVHCNYSAYTEKMPAIIRQLQLELVTQLQKAALQTNGAYTVDFDVRLCGTNKHISNIVLYGTAKYAIDIMQSNKTVKYLDTLFNLYMDMGFIAFPVLIEDVRGNFSDTADVYYTVRYWLHKSVLHTVLVYNQLEKTYYLCRLSLKDDGTTAHNVYAEKCTLDMLLIGEKGITTADFEQNFTTWEQEMFPKETMIAEANEMPMESVAENLPNYDCVSEEYVAQRLTVLGDIQQIAVNETWFNTLYTKLAYVDTDPRNSRKLIEIPIDKITVPKSKRWLGQLTSDDIINDVFAAFGGDVRAVRKLINVLRAPNLNEFDTFTKICNYVAEIPLNNTFVVINRILHQICEQIGEQ